MASNVHPAAKPLGELLQDCEVTSTRRSGPGGQHRNKVETAIVILHVPTGTRAEANERRQQGENKTEAIFRLRINLALVIRQPLDDTDSPTALWRSRCQAGRIAINSRHLDFPALLAEALDVLAHCEADVKQAAARLACTSSQLIKFLQQEPRAMLSVNVERQRRGLHPLR